MDYDGAFLLLDEADRFDGAFLSLPEKLCVGVRFHGMGIIFSLQNNIEGWNSLYGNIIFKSLVFPVRSR